MGGRSTDSEQERFVWGLTHLVRLYHDCDAVNAFLQDILGELCATVEGSVAKVGHSDLKRAKRADPSAAKRRRTDEDHKRLTLATSAARRTSAASVVLADESAKPGAARCWAEAELCRLQSAGWAHFRDTACLTIVVDGKKLGNPSEETEVFLAVDGGTHKGMWLPPQAWPLEWWVAAGRSAESSRQSVP
jgi:hypothetical protein